MSAKLPRILLAVCLMASLSGCSSVIGQDSCAAFIPVYINGTDAISDQTARQVLTNNLAGEKLCGWKKSK